MLRVITGVPGSGKTLYAVKNLLEAKERGDFLITNIDGFRYADEFIDSQTQEGITKFILERDWESFAKSLEGRKIYMVLDEAQRFYSSTGMNRNTQQQMFFFLEYHRHYGANVDLITQSHRSLNSRVYGLLHEIIQVSKVMGLTGDQRIRRLDPTTWELIGKDSFKRTSQLFDAYTSSSVDSGHQRPTNAMNRLKGQIILSGIALVCLFGFMIYMIMGWLASDESPQPQQTTIEQPRIASKPSTPSNATPTSTTTNKTPVLDIPLYKSASMKLSDFVLISQGELAGHNITRFSYRTAFFTPEELRQLGIHYRSISAGSALLIDPKTQEQVMIFMQADQPQATKQTPNDPSIEPFAMPTITDMLPTGEHQQPAPNLKSYSGMPASNLVTQ